MTKRRGKKATTDGKKRVFGTVAGGKKEIRGKMVKSLMKKQKKAGSGKKDCNVAQS